MNGPAQNPSADVESVSRVGGWAAFAITVLTAGSANGVLQAGASLLNGAPRLGGDEALTIVNVFVLTAPLAATVALITLPLARGWDPPGNTLLVALVAAVVGGLVAGNILYGLFFGAQLDVNFYSLGEALQRAPKTLPTLAMTFVMWFAVGYYEFFGWAHFFSGVIAGAFAGWAAQKLFLKPA